jgi:aryl-alcohol dehydrogenase-like predicted oxidoreductase
LGQNTGVSEEDVRWLVHYALDSGVNFIDTAAAYAESEAILGRVLQGVPRDAYLLATKFGLGSRMATMKPPDLVASLDGSLSRLGVESIDIFQLHGIFPRDYRSMADRFMPTLVEQRKAGKFQFLGVTESYSMDPRHEMLPMALDDDFFDTVMVGYNLLSPAPARTVFPQCLALDAGVIGMVPVRRSLCRPDHLEERIRYAKAHGFIAPDALSDKKPLDWLLRDGVSSLPAAGYKYAAAHPAVGTVLSGTANLEHFEENLKAILGPPLPAEDMERLHAIFGRVEEPLAD